MELSELIKVLDYKEIKGSPDKEITDIVFDSREVKKDTLFIALKGVNTDGHKYISKALENGASAILLEEEKYFKDIKDKATIIKVSNTRKELARLGERFFNYPARKIKIIGVTGTNGKTTTTHMISNVLRAQGLKTGIIGTLYIKINDKVFKTKNTTPESLEIQRYLHKMVESGVDVVIMEVSSHALYYNRVACINFDGAVFTNLTQDHLDFHKNLDDYFYEKKKLFNMIKAKSEGGFAVLNSDDDRSYDIIKDLKVPYITYGIKNSPGVKAEDIKTGIFGISYKAKSKNLDISVSMKMAGKFNIYNSLAALGVGILMDIPPEKIAKGLEGLLGVKGRFEIIDEGQDFGVIVDYAHTPDGLENVLSSAKDLTNGHLILVFGCGGDRDRTKRPIMGEIAAKYGDIVIMTSDNPRTEEPSLVIEDIKPGVEKIKNSYVTKVDRKEAIEEAVKLARKGDIIVIAGKGHEDYQIFKDKTIHFDDGEVARDALKNRLSKV